MSVNPPPNQAQANIPAILQTIKSLESGDYSHPPNAGGASGAYQYIQSTWTGAATAAGYQAYAAGPAYLAPPSVQDAVTADYVQRILNANGGNVSAVPLTWYYPAALGNPALLDVVPDPGAGNMLTPRQYQQRWLSTYYSIAGGTASPALTGTTLPNAPLTGGAVAKINDAALGDNQGCAIGGGSIKILSVSAGSAPCFISWGEIYAAEGGAVMVAGGIIMLAGIAILIARGLSGGKLQKSITAAAGSVPGVGTVIGVAGSVRSTPKAPSRTRSAPGPRTSGFRRSADDRLADRTADAQDQGRRNAAEAGPFDDR